MPKILIVEDDPFMARMYQKLFTFEHFEVLLARDGQEGIDIAKAEKPSLILMDVMMPKMNGLVALGKLKLDPDTKHIPVVMLTNLVGEIEAENALAKGAIKYIVKSDYEPQQVVEMIKRILNGTAIDSPSEPPARQS